MTSQSKIVHLDITKGYVLNPIEQGYEELRDGEWVCVDTTPPPIVVPPRIEPNLAGSPSSQSEPSA